MQYIQNLKYATKQFQSVMSLQYIAGFLDLLTVATGTQSHFVVELFKEPEFAQVFGEALVKKGAYASMKEKQPDFERNPALKALTQAVDSKVIILLSEMSNSKIGEGMMRKLAENNDYMKLYQGTGLYEGTVKRCIEEAVRPPVIEYEGEVSYYTYEQESVSRGNDVEALKIFGQCQALVTLSYYMRLLASEYQKDTSNPSAKSAIKAFYENPLLITSLQQHQRLFEHFEALSGFNEFLQTYDSRPVHYLKDYWVSVETRNKLSEEQLSMIKNRSNKLVVGDDMPVQITGLDCQHLVSAQGYSLLQCDTALSFSEPGRIGT